jgi:hypothetical protein
MMPSWGITPHPQRGHFGDVPPTLRPRPYYFFTSYFLIAILHAERHEFVGNTKFAVELRAEPAFQTKN